MPSATQKQTGNPRLQSAQLFFSRHCRPSGIHFNPSPSLDSSCPKLQRRFNTHSPAASAANAGAFLQTSLSEVTRRRKFHRSPAFTRRVTPDRVIAFITSNPHGDRNPVSYLRLGRHASRFTKGKSCNDSIMEISRTRPKRTWTPAHSRAADGKTDDFMTAPRSLPGRREAGPAARTARLSHLYSQRRLHRRELFLRDRGRA
jgi:hypothetical protein